MKNTIYKLLVALICPLVLFTTQAHATCTANVTGLEFYDLVGNNHVTISNNGTYTLSSLPSSFRLESIYSGSMGSMKFTITGSTSTTHIENQTPYNYPATGGGAWSHGAGTYTVKMRAYSGSNASGTLCDTKTITFTLTSLSSSFCSEFTSGGTIGSDETLCGTNDPSLITNVASPSGGNGGTMEYIWLKNSSASNSGATVISGATSLTYNPGPITQTTYYRRCARRCGGSYIKESNWIKKEIGFCAPSSNCLSSNSFTWSQTINPSTGSPSVQRFICGQTTTIDLTSLPSAFNGPVTVNVTDVVSYDGYAGRSNTGSQPNEKWRLKFMNGNTVVYTTPYTNDLATGVEQDSWQGSLGTATLLPNGADKIVIEHYCVANGNSTGANSVVPASICVSYSTTPQNCCTELSMVKWDMDACLSCTGNNNVFTEFTGSTSSCFPGTAYNLSASTNHSCVAGANSTAKALCIRAGEYFELKTDITPTATEDFSVSKIKYYVSNPLTATQLPPCGNTVSGINIANYMLQVYLGGTVVHTEVRNLPNNWTLETIDLSSVSALQNITSATQLKVRLTAATTSSSSYSMFDLDEFEIFGKTCPATVNVSGNVFNDINGLTDNDVNGTGIGAPSNVAIYASLIDAGNVVGSTAINNNGTYQFTDVAANNTYSMVLSTVQGTVGNPAPTADLPGGWLNTGESPNNATSDGTVDGMQTFAVVVSDVPNIDFGIQQPPTPGIDSIPETPNPGDSVCVVVPGSKFSGVDASTNGIITNLTICTFPNSIDKIEINSVVYTSTNWPSSGVTIPTNAQGEPTQGICIDPQDGQINTEINYTVTDNAGAISPCDGKVIIEFYPVSISGNVYNDTDGEVNVNGVGIGSPSSTQLYANLIDGNGNVVATTAVSATGSYLFNDVKPNTSYSMIVSTTQGTIGNAAPSVNLPFGWESVSEDCCDNTGNDGNTNGITSVSVGSVDVDNVNFGITQPLTLGNTIWNDLNQNGTKDNGEPTLNGATVKLYLDDNTDNAPDGAAVQTLTATNGTYLFTGLTPGSYIVGVTPPTTATGPAYESTDGPGQELDANNDGNDNDNGIQTTNGETFSSYVTLAAGTEPTNDDTYTAIPNSNSNLSVDFGFFQPINLSGIVFNDESGPTNVDGSPIGQAGTSQLYVNLVDAFGLVEAVKPVDNFGMYNFDDVSPNTAYKVVLSDVASLVGNAEPSSSLPTGWLTVAEDCCDGIGNDGSPDGINQATTGTSDLPNVNFGIREPVAIGNMVWVDSNKNGAIDGNEGPLAGAVVNLYEDNDNNGSPDGAAIASMTTVADGLYKFVDLNSGKFIVGVTPPTITGGTLVSSVVGEETNPNLNVDGNDNGVTTIGLEVRSNTVDLVAGTEPTGETPNNANLVPDLNSNLTIDFGFYACPTDFVFDTLDLCLNTTFDLTSIEPALFTGGSWRQNSVLVSTPTAVNSGTYTYEYNEGGCSATGDVTLVDNVPDYTPSIQIAPSAITGTSAVRVILTLSEILNKPACSDVYILSPKLLPRFQFTFNSNATTVGGIAVDNGDWQYFENANPNFYIWKYIGTSGIFPGNGSSKIGYIGSYDPNNTDGQSTFSVQVFQGSGGETNQTNNTDADLLIYFR